MATMLHILVLAFIFAGTLSQVSPIRDDSLELYFITLRQVPEAFGELQSVGAVAEGNTSEAAFAPRSDTSIVVKSVAKYILKRWKMGVKVIRFLHLHCDVKIVLKVSKYRTTFYATISCKAGKTEVVGTGSTRNKPGAVYLAAASLARNILKRGIASVIRILAWLKDKI